MMLQPSFTSICLGLSWLTLSVAVKLPLIAERAPLPLPQGGGESLPAVTPPNENGPRPGSPAKIYNWEITWSPGAPNGNTRNLFKINGNFPGPKLEVTEGDHVEVRVINQSPYNTTIHHHGIEMMATPWSDGVPGVSQNNIKPGCSFVYRWTATQHGAFWYHSHAEGQIDDGLWGPVVIHPKPSAPRPWSLLTSEAASLAAIDAAEKARIPMLLSDWRKLESPAAWEIAQASHIQLLVYDSILINGQGKVNCLTPEQQAPLMTDFQRQALTRVPGANLTDKSAWPPEVLGAIAPAGGPTPNYDAIPRDVFYGCQETSSPTNVITVTQSGEGSEKWVMFDLIGTFGMVAAQVSLDEVPLIVVSADGNDVEPMTVNSILIANGMRFTVLAKLTKPKKYTLRVSSVVDPQILFGTSTIDYRVEGQEQDTSPSVPYINERGAAVADNVVFLDPATLKPFNTPTMSPTADITFKAMTRVGPSFNDWALNINQRPKSLEDISPPLLFAPETADAVEPANTTLTIPTSAKWVDYIFQVPVGQPPHPLHFHGRHFYVLGSGQGDFPWDTVAEAAAANPSAFNLVNPNLRDTYLTPGTTQNSSWLALRRPSDNPGVWIIHCHIVSHQEGGMSMILLDHVNDIPEIVAEYADFDKCDRASFPGGPGGPGAGPGGPGYTVGAANQTGPYPVGNNNQTSPYPVGGKNPKPPSPDGNNGPKPPSPGGGNHPKPSSPGGGQYPTIPSPGGGKGQTGNHPVGGGQTGNYPVGGGQTGNHPVGGGQTGNYPVVGKGQIRSQDNQPSKYPTNGLPGKSNSCRRRRH